MSQAESTTAHQEGGDARTLAGLYEKLRSWALHAAPEAASHPRLLGQAVLLRHGMREWMAAVSRLEGPAHQAPAGDATSIGAHRCHESYCCILGRWRRAPLLLSQLVPAFLRTLLGSDLVIIAGQAASHCVKSTIEDLLEELHSEGPDLVRKVYILEDWMSAVTIPDPARPGTFLHDFTPEAETALARFAAAGMHVVRSTDPVAEWPGVKR